MPGPPTKPTREMLAQLTPKERALFGIARLANDSNAIKRGLYHYVRIVGTAWVHPCIRKVLRLHGIEHLRRIDPEEPVVLIANHQSYFDFYVALDILLRRTELGKCGLYFPVRGNYYYDHVAGLLLNLALGGLSMFPPIFREGEKRDFNRYTVEYLLELCRMPGVLIGFHPEGTRNRTGDPYRLLPAQPGIGKLVLEARPRVVPVFINGLSNSFVRQVLLGQLGKADPLYVVFGEPVDLREFDGIKSRLTTQKRVADRLRDVLVALGEEERRLRLAAGDPIPGLGATAHAS